MREQGKIISYLPTYKLNEDYLKLFFGMIRKQGGYTSNPTSRQFQSAYKKCLVHMELKDSTTGNCIPLEHISILRCTSSKQNTNAVEIISSTANAVRSLDDIDDISILHDSDHIYCGSPQLLTEYAENVISYIGGFVVRQLKKQIICENCVMALECINDKYNYVLILLRDKGGLVTPSADVINVCKNTEKIICQALAESGGNYLLKKFTTLYSVNKVLKYYVNNTIFINLRNHIGLHYIVKRSKYEALSKRNYFNKLILFQGQSIFLFKSLFI